MSADGRSPKRQRLSSYSPASTPTETKTPFVQHPQTPPPSVHMSPSWQSQSLPGLATGSGGGANFPTPPSPAVGYQNHSIARSVGSDGGSAQQTPASEGERQDAEMQDSGAGKGEGDVSMVDDDGHRRTDHERQEAEDSVSSLPGPVALYKLGTEPVPRSRPHASQNIIELYDLQRMQASVARKDPVTGEKINKLRRSYEGKVKDMKLEGRNKASKNPKELEVLLEPQLDIVIPDGRTLWQADRLDGIDFFDQGTDTIADMLGSALDMRPGRLPKVEDAQWKNMLGLDDSAAAKPGVNALPAKAVANHRLTKTAPGAAVQRSAPASPRNSMRPTREGKKRSYHDASWTGYGEGFGDEDGYSTGDGAGRGASASASKRQKRKDFSTSASASPSFSTGGGSSNSGMVGVRSS